MRRNLLIALLAVLALTLSAPAAWALDEANPCAGERVSANAVSNWWSLLREWWANGLPARMLHTSEVGPDMDPNGASIDLGPGADPDGFRAEDGPGIEPIGDHSEVGPHMDPNGSREIGSGMDPNGNHSEYGPHMDPDGSHSELGPGADPNG